MQPPQRPRVRVLPQARESIGASPLSRAGKVKAALTCHDDLPPLAAQLREAERARGENRFSLSKVLIDEGRVWNVVLYCSDEGWPDEVVVLDVFFLGGAELR